MIPFADGTCRHVFTVGLGQYVIGDGGERVYGVWWLPPEVDEPTIVERRP